MRATDEEALTDVQKKIVKKIKEMDRNLYELPLRYEIARSGLISDKLCCKKAVSAFYLRVNIVISIMLLLNPVEG